MKTRTTTLWVSLLLAFVLASCSPEPVPVAESPTATAESITESPSITPTDPSAFTNVSEEATAYYDGVVVLSQYYTFLGNDLHEKAYDLLSSTAKSHHPSVEQYLEISRLSFHQVEIKQIVPYKDWAPLFGLRYNKDTENKKQFVVVLKAWGEGNLSGSAMNGQVQTLHILLILEGGQWKIDEFSGAVPINP